MTLPTTTSINGTDDDSDMFGPPRSSPVGGYHHHRSRVPMISPKLRQCEERKRILQLCAHKLERIKDSETNLRRSVCINNTYSRLTDEVRREKLNRDLANLPKSETKPESARDNIFSPYNSCGIDSSPKEIRSCSLDTSQSFTTGKPTTQHISSSPSLSTVTNQNLNQTQIQLQTQIQTQNQLQTLNQNQNQNQNQFLSCAHEKKERRHRCSSNNVDNDLEILNRELNAISASMPLIDPEITQGAEQLEKAVSSRKRSRSEDESDRLVREALSFYNATQRHVSGIDDLPLDCKRQKLQNINNNNNNNNNNSITGDLEFDLALRSDMNHQGHKEFEVIMDALRLGTPSPPPCLGSDSCGQAAMMSETGVFPHLVVTSLET